MKMIGVSNCSGNKLKKLLKDDYDVFLIKRKTNKMNIRDDDGNIVKTIPSNNPIENNKEAIFTSSEKQKIFIVDGISTLLKISNYKPAKYIICDTPETLAKHGIENKDVISSGISYIKNNNFDKNIKKYVKKSGFGFELVNNNFNLINILTKIDDEVVNKLLFSFVLGLIEKGEFKKELRPLVNDELRSLLHNWLETYAPDSLFNAFVDLSIYAKSIYKEYYSNKENKKKFKETISMISNVHLTNLPSFKLLLKYFKPKVKIVKHSRYKVPKFLSKYREKFPIE